MSDEQLVIGEVVDHVGYVILNDTGRLNPFGLELARQCLAVLERHRADAEVRAVVLRSSARVFSVGGDIRQMLDDVEETGDAGGFFREPLATFNQMAVALRTMPKPVLAAVHGAVAGVAFNLMLACDLILAAEPTRFTQAFVSLGLSADGGGSWELLRRVGRARASELLMLPTVIDAPTALAWGLVNWTEPKDTFEAQTRELAARLAAGPTNAVARTKALLNQAHGRTFAEQIEQERQAQLANSDHPNFGEGLRAFVEKRDPDFTP